MAAKLHYLTVQDMLWINVQTTRKVNTYTYANLEEATYYQYAYRDSDELVPQAARFLSGFSGKAPFNVGSDATAFVAVLAFLTMNGRSVTLPDSDGAEWFDRAKAGIEPAKAAIGEGTAESHEDHGAPLREVVKDLLVRFPQTISAIGGTPIELLVDAGSH